jgi:predicted AlkP superfamily phosphohydrolase/phosphomutase
MNKVLVIGIDGLDPQILARHRNQLPNFKKLMEKGTSIKFTSVYPYDSIPIWSSIYTGLTPAKHGLLKPINYLQNEVITIEKNNLKGKTFWDYASINNKRVCIINPFVAYPPWKVNGVMASGPIGGNGSVQIYPEYISDVVKIPSCLGGVHSRYPLRGELSDYRVNAEEITRHETEFALKIFRDFSWDLGFVCYLTLDGIEHFFWRYYDNSDPTYKNSIFKDIIPEFYKLFDNILAEFQKLDFTHLIVLSDHGHGMRSIKLVNVNEILRSNNLLYLNKNKLSSKRYIFERIKAKSLEVIYKYDLDGVALQLSRTVPMMGKKIQKPSLYSEEKNFLAYTCDLVGMNPCGGIRIVKDNLGDIEYERLRKKIISQLSNLEDQSNGEKIINWIIERERLYQGKYLELYPDIVFELHPIYGINWNICGPLIQSSYAHKIISGGHKKDAVLLFDTKIEPISGRAFTSIDIAPTILDILGIKPELDLDGRSILDHL